MIEQNPYAGAKGRAQATSWWNRRRLSQVPPEAESRARQQAALLVQIYDTSRVCEDARGMKS